MQNDKSCVIVQIPLDLIVVLSFIPDKASKTELFGAF